jgi:hypothetical protein
MFVFNPVQYYSSILLSAPLSHKLSFLEYETERKPLERGFRYQAF